MIERKALLQGLVVATVTAGACIVWQLTFRGKVRAKDETVTEVRASDIPWRVRIVGRLGQPLYTIVDLEGEWLPAEEVNKKGEIVKWPRPHLRIRHVNGEELAEPREFPVELVDVAISQETKLSPTAGEAWRLKAFEIGGMVGYPAEVWEALNDAVSEPYGHRFLTELRVISHEVVKRPEARRE